MIDPFENLCSRVSVFGNHHRKYLINIENNKELFLDSLDTHGVADQVHLWKPATNVKLEIKVVSNLSDVAEEKLALLGTYYSMQYLVKLLRAVDVLAFRADTSHNLTYTYRLFMRRIGTEFRELIAFYMETLMEYFFGARLQPEFVVCGVGTRADQDDLDVGIIDDGSAAREHLNRVISSVNREMLKHATPLHCYLSEHVGFHGYSASIDEYLKLLSKEIQDFVIITEMLSAWPILGSWSLFNRFRKQVTSLYYHSRKKESKKHEAYLRGILGEVRNHLFNDIRKDRINPKDDALRMIKSILYAYKTIYDIQDAVNAWGILDRLRQHDAARKHIYDHLEVSLSFFETLRFLYQLFVVQEENIKLDEPVPFTLFNDIARTMGYREIGVASSWDHLIIHYYEHLKQCKADIEILLKDASDYLKHTSTFFTSTPRSHPNRKRPEQMDENLPLEILRKTRFFRGTTFWDDFLTTLESNQDGLLSRFVDGFNRLPNRYRQVLIENYAQFARYTFYGIIELQNILWRNRKNINTDALFQDFSTAFLNEVDHHYDVIWRMARIFTLYPISINQYLSALPDDKVQRFMKRLEGEVWDSEIARKRNQILALCKIYTYSSEHFKRIFKNAITLIPSIIQNIDQPAELRRMAAGLYSTMDVAQDIEKKKKILAEYHDIEFLRIALETLDGQPFDLVNESYTRLVDNYFQALFEICKSEVDTKFNTSIVTRDAVAIFASGGLAREQAYDDDWDLIILVDSSDSVLHKYIEMTMAKMHYEIVKRGSMPHYRMADIFGNYVTPMTSLKFFLGQNGDTAFIEKSQFLSSRLLVGSRKFLKQFNQEILREFIWKDKVKYIQQMIQEIRDKQADYQKRSLSSHNVKECSGGLRDIELIMLISKAYYELDGPLNASLIDKVTALNPKYARKLDFLKKSFAFLKRLRDIYRLTVALEDDLDEYYLTTAARIMGYQSHCAEAAVAQLMKRYHRRTQRSQKIINELLNEIEAQLAAMV